MDFRLLTQWNGQNVSSESLPWAKTVTTVNVFYLIRRQVIFDLVFKRIIQTTTTKEKKIYYKLHMASVCIEDRLPWRQPCVGTVGIVKKTSRCERILKWRITRILFLLQHLLFFKIWRFLNDTVYGCEHVNCHLHQWLTTMTIFQ